MVSSPPDSAGSALPPRDTDRATYALQLRLVGSLSKSERFSRALALTALTRRLAWEGAVRHVGASGERAIVERFLSQLYGHELSPALRRLIDQV